MNYDARPALDLWQTMQPEAAQLKIEHTPTGFLVGLHIDESIPLAVGDDVIVSYNLTNHRMTVQSISERRPARGDWSGKTWRGRQMEWCQIVVEHPTA